MNGAFMKWFMPLLSLWWCAGYNAAFAIYWCAVTAVYLAWSFLSGDWHITWVVWPVAGCSGG